MMPEMKKNTHILFYSNLVAVVARTDDISLNDIMSIPTFFSY